MIKKIFSGIKPSGDLHIGNYLGAISQWIKMQDDYDCIFCVVDHHAITVDQDPKILRQRIIEIARIYMAFGIDPSKSIIFQQSDIKEHAELCWILNTVTRMSDLFKMTQFKDKTDLSEENFDKEKINKAGVGLFDYPVLMAADILLYDTDLVPVGDDQVQHVELTRTLARRFNKKYKKDIFKIPQFEVLKQGARIMSLTEPTKKMSKSDKNENSYIALLDDADKARKKIMKAVTDTEGIIQYNMELKPGISNLLSIYSILAGKSVKDLEKEYSGKGYGDFKKDLAELTAEFLETFQYKYKKIKDTDVRDALTLGAVKLKDQAEAKMEEVKRVIGYR